MHNSTYDIMLNFEYWNAQLTVRSCSVAIEPHVKTQNKLVVGLLSQRLLVVVSPQYYRAKQKLVCRQWFLSFWALEKPTLHRIERCELITVSSAHRGRQKIKKYENTIEASLKDVLTWALLEIHGNSLLLILVR